MRKGRRSVVSLLVAFCIISMSIIGVLDTRVVNADTVDTINLYKLSEDASGEGWNYDSSTSTLTITSGSVKLTSNGSSVSYKRVYVNGSTADEDINITLENLRIIEEMKGNRCAFYITGTNKSNVNINLVGSNYLKSSNNYSGIEKYDGGNATLTISGTGGLTAVGGTYGAGIGSNQKSVSNIVINGGTITAAGGGYGPGIGSRTGDVSNITINDGTVTATGGSYASGIGNGIYAMTVSDITINGGTVTATGGGGNDEGNAGAGIGGCGKFASKAISRNIVINGGTVVAQGGHNKTNKHEISGAGIGGGIVESLTINGGNITAIGGGQSDTETYPGAGIGSSGYSQCSNILITGGIIDATAGKTALSSSARAIGQGGSGTMAGTNVITGGTIVTHGYVALSSFTVDGGSINCNDRPSSTITPKNTNGDSLVEYVYDGFTPDESVDASILTMDDYDYILNDVCADADGKIYLYLPSGAADEVVKVDFAVDSEIVDSHLAFKGGVINGFELEDTGRELIGWYEDQWFNSEFEFGSSVVDEDMCLYARFTDSPVHTHEYDDDCDADCNVCGLTRVPPKIAETVDNATLIYEDRDNDGVRETVVISVEIVTSDIVSSITTNHPEVTSVVLDSNVQRIDKNAFKNTLFSSIQLNEGLKSIISDAFYGCVNLTEIDIPSTVTSIGLEAFYNCTNLTSIEIPSGVDYIYFSTFYGCTSLESVTIPNTVKTIDHGAFQNCTSLTSVVIPDSVTTINYEAFSGCTNLETVVLPNGITSMGARLFRECSSLANIEIPNSVETIGEKAFVDCTSLKSIEFPDSVTTIGRSAFNGCSCLEEVLLSDGLEMIGSSAFAGCTNLKSITIPSSVTTINSQAFRNCTNLETINIPDRITTIPNGLFWGCSSLESIDIPDTVTSIEKNAFYYCSSLTSISIPSGVTTIDINTFKGCEKLETVNLPDSITTINNEAFSGCTSLKSIEVPASVTTMPTNPFPIATMDSISVACENYDVVTANMGRYLDKVVRVHAPVDVEAIAPTWETEGCTAGIKCQYCEAELEGFEPIAPLSQTSVAYFQLENGDIVPFANAEEICDYFNSDEARIGNLVFMEDIDLGEDKLVINADSDVAIDADGHTVTNESDDALVYCYGNLSIESGTWDGDINILEEGSVEIKSGTFDHAFNIGDNGSVTVDADFDGELLSNAVCVYQDEDGRVICKAEHEETVDESREATCTEPGRTAGTHCSACGEIFVATTEIGALGHTAVEDAAVAATTTSTGLTAGSHCSVCGEVLVAQQVVPKLTPAAPSQPSQPSTPSTPSTPVGSTSEGGVAGFVERLYTVALGRASEPNGKAAWIAAIRGGESGAEVAKGFLFSDEFLNKNMSNEDFVTVLYRVFFDRQPDAAGHAAWVAALERGESKQDVIMGFINSTEWANVCVRYGILSGGTGVPSIEVEPNESVVAFATRLYTTCLKRTPDNAGLMAWARQLANLRDTGTNAAHGFFFSDEMNNNPVSNEEFVTRLYLTFMDRNPDTAGFNAWVGQLNSGVSREEVFQGFAQSTEFGTICANYGIIR